VFIKHLDVIRIFWWLTKVFFFGRRCCKEIKEISEQGSGGSAVKEKQSIIEAGE